MAKDEERFIQIMREASELVDDVSVKHFFNSLADMKEQSDIVIDDFALDVSFMAHNDAWERLNYSDNIDAVAFISNDDIEALLNRYANDEDVRKPWIVETNIRVFNELDVPFLKVWNAVREIKSQEKADFFGYDLQDDDSHSDFKNFLASSCFSVEDVGEYIECSPYDANYDRFYKLIDKLNISEEDWQKAYEKVNLNIKVKFMTSVETSKGSRTEWKNINVDGFTSMKNAYKAFQNLNIAPKKICLEFEDVAYSEIRTLDVLEQDSVVDSCLEPHFLSGLHFSPNIPYVFNGKDAVFNSDIAKENIKELGNLYLNEPIQFVFVCYDKNHNNEPLIGIVSADDRKIGTDLQIQLFDNDYGNKVFDKTINIQSHDKHEYGMLYESNALKDTLYAGLKEYHSIDFYEDIDKKPIPIRNLPMKVKLAYNEITENKQNHIENQSKNKDKNKACI